MNEVEKAKKEGRGYYTSTRDPNLNHNQRGVNVRAAQLAVGVAGDLTAPIMAVIDVNPGPGDALRGQHLHYGDAINLIVTGSVCRDGRPEEYTSELQSLMRISYAVFCLKNTIYKSTP